MENTLQQTENTVQHQVVQSHYRRLATSYNQFLYYSPRFVRSLTAKMIEKLQLRPEDALVDLGCGTGMYSLDILEQVPLQSPILGVDPFPEMLAKIPSEAAIEPLALDALSFSSRPGHYDKILIKEAVHHVQRRRELFANLHQRLADDGILLLVHVPPRVQYPLFRGALERCQQWHADPLELIQRLEETGFQVQRDALQYRHSLPKDCYFEMVRGQYMSVLSSFSPEEIQAGLDEMRQTYAERETLEFTDHFDFLTATKAL